jgi:hypothetical protein
VIKSCFVIMPIGDQVLPKGLLTSADLRTKYTDLIKEALLRARPSLDVVRADDVSTPGVITADIATRLMYSDYVLADITYSNSNVFYELGLRHACRCGTILIRDAAGPQPPFDLFDLRHIAYHNTPSGLKALAAHIATQLDWLDAHAGHPDNRFMELAKLTRFPFPMYSRRPYPSGIEGAIDQQLYSLSFYKQEVVFDIEVTACAREHVEFITELSYLVTNRTSERHHWQMQKKFKSETGEALEVRFNNHIIDHAGLENRYGRGIRAPRIIEPGETASAYFRMKERFPRPGSDLCTSYHPATDLKVIVRNPFRELIFDFETFYFTEVSPQRDADKTVITFERGLLPHQGVRLTWKGV